MENLLFVFVVTIPPQNVVLCNDIRQLVVAQDSYRILRDVISSFFEW